MSFGAPASSRLQCSCRPPAGLRLHLSHAASQLTHHPVRPAPPEQALQFRLREDLKASGGDLAAFDQLKEASCSGGGGAGRCVSRHA